MQDQYKMLWKTTATFYYANCHRMATNCLFYILLILHVLQTQDTLQDLLFYPNIVVFSEGQLLNVKPNKRDVGMHYVCG